MATDGDAIRNAVHAMWAGVAVAWAEYADEVDRNATVLTERMLEATEPGPGDRVLELACGPGGVGLAAAERVRPDGVVVCSDVAAEMAEVAARRAAERGLDNVSTAVIDIEDIAQPDSSFDVVVCREGMMFALEPASAAAEIHRVLRPGGRVGVSVWGPREDNPWLGLIFDAFTAQTGAEIPPPGVPGPFGLSDADHLGALLRDAGLAGVTIERVPMIMSDASWDGWWARRLAVAGPLANVFGALPVEAQEGITARVREAMAPYTDASGALSPPAVVLLASGHRSWGFGGRAGPAPTNPVP